MKWKLITILISFLISGMHLHSQSTTSNEFINKRTSDLLRGNASAYPMGLSKFIQNLNMNNLDEWRSASSVISIDGIPYKTLPLNYTSPDFVPIDLLQIDSVQMYSQPDISGYLSLPSGGINFITRKLSDTLLIKMRGFTGSETGDPLIYRFTRQDIPIVNKNKIVPSVVISLEGNKKLRYRFTGGYFGYFAFNSSENSSVLSNLGQDLIKRQNRQILGSAELEYPFSEQQKISFFSSLIHFYGWEMPPFITSFVHLRSFNFANRLSITNLFNGFSAGIKYDGNISRIRELDPVPSGKLGLSDISLFSTFSFVSGIFNEFSLSTEAGRYAGTNLDPGTSYEQTIFDNNSSYFYYHITPQFNISVSERIKLISTTRFEKNILPVHAISTSMKIIYNISPGHSLSVSGSSLASFPEIFEKYGRFITFREVNDIPDIFTISGNQDLTFERVNTLSALYRYDNTGIYIIVNPYIRNVRRQITMNDLNIIASSYPGDIIRNAVYYNAESKAKWGINSSLKADLSFLSLAVSHSGIYNKTLFPSNVLLISSGINLNNWGLILFEYLYSSARNFKEFELTNKDDISVFKPDTPQINLFTISYTQHIPGFYSLKDITISMKIDNIFNRKMKFHPMGNNLDRAIEFYLSFCI